MENQNVRLAVSFLIGLVVGLGIYWIFDRNAVPVDDISTAGDDTSELATTTNDVVTLGANGIAVGAQRAGKVVTLSEITLKNPAWVAIHDDVNGQPGKVLGAHLFDAGTRAGSIELLRSTVDGKSYLIVIHKSDGNATYSSQTDKPLTDDSGKILMTSFMVGTPQVQASEDGTVDTSSSVSLETINPNSK